MIPGLIDFCSWSNTIKRDEDHILRIDYFDELLQVEEDSFIDLVKGERFNFVPQKAVAFLNYHKNSYPDALINEGIEIYIKLIKYRNFFILVG